MIQVIVNKGDAEVAESGFGIEILTESVIAVKALYDSIRKKSEDAAKMYLDMIRTVDFSRDHFFENDDDDTIPNLLRQLEFMSEEGLRDEE